MTDDQSESPDPDRSGPDRSGTAGTAGTVCPFCAVGCRLAREGGRVTGRSGPANPDGRLCRKGLGAVDAVGDDERLTAPLVREDGDLVPVSWERALDRVVTGFESIADDHGADALAFLGAPRCTNEENYLLAKLARTLGTNNVDNRARLCHAGTARRMEARLGWPAMTNTLADLGEADAFLVVGANPAASQPVAFDGTVRPAVDGGATLIHVDPHENETTRKARFHVTPRPGTDALVVTALCSLLVEAGHVDREFVTERTTGFERFRASLAGRDPDADARAAGVDGGTLRDVARAIGDADRVAVLTGTGGDDAATADALINLLLLTGNLGRPGTGMNLLRGLNNEQGAVDAGCLPDRLPGHRPVTDATARERVAGVWGHPVPREPGDTEHDLLRQFGDGIRGALVVGENPAVSAFDPDWTAGRLDALGTLVVQEVYPTETTARADVVLPAAVGVEKAGTVTNLDRQVQRLRPAADPPGEARPDFAILRDLGTRLVGDAFDYDGPAEVFAEFSRVAPPYGGIAYAELDGHSRRWPARNRGEGGTADGDGIASADGIANGDGKGNESAGDEGEERGEGILYRGSFATGDGRASFVPMDPGYGDTGSEGGGNGEEDELQLIVGGRAGSFTPGGDGPVDRRLTVHPDDAAIRGIEDGDSVVVSNGTATVETTACVGEAVRPGTVYLHASVADPLVRSGGEGSTVELRARSSA